MGVRGRYPHPVNANPAVVDVLRHVVGLQSLLDAEVDVVLLSGRSRRLTAGQVLFREGEAGDTMALLLEGELSVRVGGAGGPPIELRRIQAGELVGELVAVDPAPRSATVVVTQPGLAMELDRAALDTLIAHAPRVGSHLLGMIIRATTLRLRQVDRQIAEALGEALEASPESEPPADAPSDPSPAASGVAAGHVWQKLTERLRTTS